MPLTGVVVLRFATYPDYVSVNSWRRDLLIEFGPASFFNPITFVKDCGHGPIPVDDGSFWFDVEVTRDYYGEGYERGDAEWFVRLAEWLEPNIPGCQVWYGHSCSDESIRPFGPPERAAFLGYFRRVGHDPYDSRRAGFSLPGHGSAD